MDMVGSASLKRDNLGSIDLKEKRQVSSLGLGKSYKFAIARNPDDASDGFKKVKTLRQCKKP